MSKMATFTFVGLGAAVLGGIIAYASWPKHQDLLDLVNKNNRLSKQPLHCRSATTRRNTSLSVGRLSRFETTCPDSRRRRGNLPHAPRTGYQPGAMTYWPALGRRPRH